MKFVLFGRLKKTQQEQSAPAPGFPGQKAQQGQAQLQPQSQKPSVEERVSYLVSQGLAEPEIIKILKDEGYSFQEIDSGISNILKSRVSDEPIPQGGGTGTQPEDLAPLMSSGEDQNSPEGIQARVTEQMDAVMEQMMEEKLTNFAAELERIDAKFEDIDNKIQKIAARINEVEASGKRQDDDEDVKLQEVNVKESELEPRIAGLERAFKDIIPGLVESIRELKEVIVTKKREREPELEQENLAELGATTAAAGTHAHGAAEEAPAKTGDMNIFD